MLVLKAPHPVYARTIILPNPKLGDSYTPIRELDIKRSIDNTLYSYKKTTNGIRLLYEIDITRKKSIELIEFYQLFGGNLWQLTDHNSVVHIVICRSELTLQNFRRSWYSPSDPYGSEEAVTINMEFEAV